MKRSRLLALSIALLAGLTVADLPSSSAASAAPASSRKVAETLLSQGRPATASSTESASFPASNAVDGNASTRWSSQFSDPQWIQVDLGATATISRIRLNWETAYGRAYRIETSDDGQNWTSLRSQTSGDGGVDEITDLSGSGRYVRLVGTERGTQWGYSLWEFEIYGEGGSPQPPTSSKFPFAPYVDTSFGLNLADYARETGQKYVTLAFYNSGGGCQGVWPTNDDGLLNNVKGLRGEGGDVVVATGGWNANDLARRCTDAQSLANVYQTMLDRYGVDHLDIDPEAGDVYNNLERPLVDRRSAALKILQDNFRAKGKTLTVSFTLAVNPDNGFNADNLYVLESAKAHGVEIGLVNPMTMDYYDGVSGDQMGARSIKALQAVFGQVKNLLPGKTDAEYWKLIGATPMIGQNDNRSEVFTLDDARKVVDFARTNHLGRLHFWSIGRDNGGCPGQKEASPTCSGISQQRYEFTGIFKQFTG
ncbi:discoidin domain-containing protein [Streptomyces sp. KR80]|uniref:discoidin domain-containing protein n=1 Tax=Streptomyces sp. KR80 TaxID=3457426 RepID=UPI003FD0DA94